MSACAPDVAWAVYKFFHDPPGTPKNLKCVSCKVALGTGALGATAVNLYLTRKFVPISYAKTMIFAGLATTSALASVFLFRMAHDHRRYNERLRASHKAKIQGKHESA